MSEQIPMFVEDLNDAIRDTVKALGGWKRVGYDLQPEKGVEGAGRWLSDCCNPDRREKLSPEQLAYIRKRARQHGVHILAAFEAREAGYAPPVPLEPESERAALMREFVLMGREMKDLAGRLNLSGLFDVEAHDA